MDTQVPYQAKLVLLGDMGAGKSSLVLRFVKAQFHDYQVRSWATQLSYKICPSHVIFVGETFSIYHFLCILWVSVSVDNDYYKKCFDVGRAYHRYLRLICYG